MHTKSQNINIIQAHNDMRQRQAELLKDFEVYQLYSQLVEFAQHANKHTLAAAAAAAHTRTCRCSRTFSCHNSSTP